MFDTYFPLVVLFVLAAGFVITVLMLSILLGPSKPSQIKDDPFECGTIGSGSPTDRLSVKFYLVATIFILFDIEIVFMYPWAVSVVQIGWSSFFAMLSFVFVLAIGLAYIWKRGVLDWN